MKPFTDERVAQCLERLRARRAPTQGGAERLVARRKRALVFLRMDEVWAFEAADRLAYVHTSRGRFEIDLSLSSVEASIGRALLRVHRNWLVNADHVKELDGLASETEIVIGPKDGERSLRVPVARERVQSVREALLRDATGIRAR